MSEMSETLEALDRMEVVAKKFPLTPPSEAHRLGSTMGSLKLALIDRLDGILVGLAGLVGLLMILVTLGLDLQDKQARCIEALKSSKNGVIIMSLCK